MGSGEHLPSGGPFDRLTDECIKKEKTLKLTNY